MSRAGGTFPSFCVEGFEVPRILSKNIEYSPMGFPLSREAHQRYDLAQWRSIQSDRSPAKRVWAARHLAEQMNARRDFTRPKTLPARGGELLCAGLITEALRYLITEYSVNVVAEALDNGLATISDSFGPAIAEHTLPVFVSLYPPEPVLTGAQSEAGFLAGRSELLSNRAVATREVMLVHLTMENPALDAYSELYDDADLRRRTPYEPLVGNLEAYFDGLPPVPGRGKKLMETLREPFRAHPHSLEEQLAFIRQYWADFLPEDLLEQLAVVEGVVREEHALRGHGPGPSQALTFGWLADLGYDEPEAFSVDRDWMSNLVLIAKTVYVWLDQLSKQYGRDIHRIDQIPDEELDRLAAWGFTGLWLIGLWERSSVSRDIKQRMGNPEALSSAYSLYDYEIAHDLGGQAAYHNLAERAWRRGIRLASDMVPNHMGIYSKWMVEHPDWFLQLDQPPYPSYRYEGPNLSPDDRIGLYLEDGYWGRRDAAVVFKRVDHHTGHVRYIYHGNDGTNMPWNDTAQLNYLMPQVREAVIQTILHVARSFPIIRFDAAMTLAKRHYQRLWFPKPGDAGAIPSRAEHGMTRADFDAAFPAEFWREVVDRISAEAPDTLLLAEAFWLMEGYFVRTLGMHRVYNSAFMNMLKMEDNAKYRQTVRNVLEFSPEVLQRFVNFMNNPDEDTAEAQFGKGDKYFGVAVLMATMPGLPMFGHGQVEGFTEKYGMEYRRAYWDETPDTGLIARHEAELFPLMRKRHIFSGAKHFAFFDFVTPEGWVDENVFAYSNRSGRERAIILYNNAYQSTRGVLHTSTAINEGHVDAPRLRRITLAEALALNTEDTCYYIFRDHRSGLEYLRHAQRLAREGIHADLGGYQYQALVDWHEVHDFDHSWGHLHDALGGCGVPSVEEAYLEMYLSSVIAPFRKVVSADMLSCLLKPAAPPEWAAFRKAMSAFLQAIGQRIGAAPDDQSILEAIEEELELLWSFPERLAAAAPYEEVATFLLSGLPEDQPDGFWRVPIVWAIVRRMGAVAAADSPISGFSVSATSAAWMREWLLSKQIAASFRELDGDAWHADMDARLVRICVAHAERLPALRQEPWAPVLDALFSDPDVRFFLRFNRFGGRLWFNKEQLERMLHMLFLTLSVTLLPQGAEAADTVALCYEDLRVLLDAAEDAGYDFDRMLDSLK